MRNGSRSNTSKNAIKSTEATDIKSMVTSLIEMDCIDDDGLPEDFEKIDPIIFAKELARYRSKAYGTQRYKNKIRTYLSRSADISNALITKLSEAQPYVTGEVMINAIDRIEISLDHSVMMAEPFLVKIMPNGGIGIRNFHRVIAINSSPSIQIKVPNSIFYREIKKIIKSIQFSDQKDTGCDYKFFIIHREIENGSFVLSRKLPSQFSDWGQTTIFIDNNIDLSASRLLSSLDINRVWQESFTGHAIFRTFADYTLIYANNRAPDELDTVLDLFSSIVLETFDTPFIWDFERYNVSDRVDDYARHLGLNEVDGVMKYYVNYLLIDEDNFESYSKIKSRQISYFDPFFDTDVARPCLYHITNDPYWDISERLGHKIIAIEIPMKVLSDINDLPELASKFFKNLIKSTGFARDSFKVVWDYWWDEEHLHSLNSRAVKARLKEAEARLQEIYKEVLLASPSIDAESAISEVFDNLDDEFKFKFVILFDERPDYVELNNQMKMISGTIRSSVQLYIPYIGFYQSYDCGEYDSGVASLLMTNEQLYG